MTVRPPDADPIRPVMSQTAHDAVVVDLRDPAVAIADDLTWIAHDEDEDLSVLALRAHVGELTRQLELAHALVRQRRRVAKLARRAYVNERNRLLASPGDTKRTKEVREASVEFRLESLRASHEDAQDALRDATEHRDLLDRKISSYQTLLNASMRIEELAHAVDRFAA